MIDLLLSIFCSSLIFLLFKWFEKESINTFGAIVINYATAAVCGFLIGGAQLSVAAITGSDWIWNALILGTLFISLFYIMARTAQTSGPSVASVANKMALIIPVLFAFFWHGDRINPIKAIGIVMALVAVFLASKKKRKPAQSSAANAWLFPIILFLGSGFIDTFLKLTQSEHLGKVEGDFELFSASIFAIAFIYGLSMLLIRKGMGINRPTIIGGLVLGIINYGSIYFLLKAFESSGWESSVIFPVNNMSVVAATAIASYLIFKEQISRLNLGGIILALVSIILILTA